MDNSVVIFLHCTRIVNRGKPFRAPLRGISTSPRDNLVIQNPHVFDQPYNLGSGKIKTKLPVRNILEEGPGAQEAPFIPIIGVRKGREKLL